MSPRPPVLHRAVNLAGAMIVEVTLTSCSAATNLNSPTSTSRMVKPTDVPQVEDATTGCEAAVASTDTPYTLTCPGGRMTLPALQGACSSETNGGATGGGALAVIAIGGSGVQGVPDDPQRQYDDRWQDRHRRRVGNGGLAPVARAGERSRRHRDHP